MTTEEQLAELRLDNHLLRERIARLEDREHLNADNVEMLTSLVEQLVGWMRHQRQVNARRPSYAPARSGAVNLEVIES